MAQSLIRTLNHSSFDISRKSIYNSFWIHKFSSSSYRTYSTKKYFDKILIANRGEIACRIIRTAKNLGIKTVAIHSNVDSQSKHVMMADEAINLGGTTSQESYLRIDAVLDAIKKTQANAVHPGYGFLSENAKFAEALEKNNVTFIGPSSFSIQSMGDKIESKKIAKTAGVHVIPGKLAEAHNDEEVMESIREIGYPVMIKASAGGGGKGMRIAWNDKEAREGFRMAKQEAKSSFGDDRILIEKYIDEPRHIEIQIMGDKHGNYVYLNERECSIQRRNQKVLEESPSPFLDPKTRRAMGEQAVQLAQAVKYFSAGTVEFLVDSKKNFYFLEMNTRLQVEHPVTEYVTGLDLVELMIRVAAGERLPLSQKDVPIKGWAMEARVYAEDPLRGFLPSIGLLSKYKEPVSKGSVRVDSGILEGDEISIYYDPMIAKVVGYGKDRRESIDRLKTALDSYVIRGVNHNICFLRSVLEHPRYIKGDITTKFIPEEYPEGFKGHVLTEEEKNQLITIAAAIHFIRVRRNTTISGQIGSFRLQQTENFVITIENENFPVSISESESGGLMVRREKMETLISSEWTVDSDVFTARIDISNVIAQLAKILPLGYQIIFLGNTYTVMVYSQKQFELSAFMPVKQKIDMTKYLVAPMPGRVNEIFVKEGDKVVVGQVLLIIEAMKMQNALRAERDCVIKKIHQKQNVAVDDILIEFA